ncbi:unnamed protein product, partial [Didymodactylos carnosus]
AIENNMFRAPIYNHNLEKTDFLIIQNGDSYFIRNVSTIFTIGQECPLIEIPVPNSKRVGTLQRELLQVYIYKSFAKSNEEPRRIRIEDVKKAFPRLAESSIRKRLKLCSDFRRAGEDSNSWIIRRDFRLPSEDEIREMVTPEKCCLIYLCSAAEQRLKDAGFRDKCLIAMEDDDNNQAKLDDEIICAPWNTSKAYIDAVRGKCFLQIYGVGGEHLIGSADTKRLRGAVTGTDADLRRLQLKDARKLLLKFGIAENIIQSLTRWEIVDLVRTLSTQKAKEGIGGVKFARGARHIHLQHLEKYREDCQRQFELQNRTLSCQNLQQTDDDTSEEDAEMKEMGETLKNLLCSPKEQTRFNHERRELHHLKFKDILKNFANLKGNKQKEEEEEQTSKNLNQINKTIELVRKDSIIQAYIKIRNTKDDCYIRQYYALDEVERESLRRERRRLQEQLRRVKRNEARYRHSESFDTTLPPNSPSLSLRSMNSLKKKYSTESCSQLSINDDSLSLTSSIESSNDINSNNCSIAVTESKSIVSVYGKCLNNETFPVIDGVKLIIPKRLLKKAEEVKRKSLILHIPKNILRYPCTDNYESTNDTDNIG